MENLKEQTEMLMSITRRRKRVEVVVEMNSDRPGRATLLANIIQRNGSKKLYTRTFPWATVDEFCDLVKHFKENPPEEWEVYVFESSEYTVDDIESLREDMKKPDFTGWARVTIKKVE